MTEQAQQEEDWQVQLQASKSLGDAAFRTGDYATAIHHYTAALSLDPTHAVLLSNRSAAYLHTQQTSKALWDAQAVVATGKMGLKGTSRLAAALQALGRYEAALIEWERILRENATHAGALKGKEDCKREMEKKNQETAAIEKDDDKTEEKEEDDDMLDDFFNEVDEAATAVQASKELAAQPVATDAIKHHKRDLGTAAEQIERLLASNYEWRNLNPYFVLDLPHTCTAEDVSRRYKALSLLLHPDRNRNNNKDSDKVQEAYDHVQKAKARLDDEHKAKHARELIEVGLKQGQEDWEKQQHPKKSSNTLQECQTKAVQRIFAQVEMKRRQVEQRERQYEQRERQQEEEAISEERSSRELEKKWNQQTRVEKRIGNWRDFAKKKKKKGSKT